MSSANLPPKRGLELLRALWFGNYNEWRGCSAALQERKDSRHRVFDSVLEVIRKMECLFFELLEPEKEQIPMFRPSAERISAFAVDVSYLLRHGTEHQKHVLEVILETIRWIEYFYARMQENSPERPLPGPSSLELILTLPEYLLESGHLARATVEKEWRAAA